jgi:hypothetical protein
MLRVLLPGKRFPLPQVVSSNFEVSLAGLGGGASCERLCSSRPNCFAKIIDDDIARNIKTA